MSEKSVKDAVVFGERVAASQAFADLFRDGMALVEQTAAYLDGPGRQEAKKLSRQAALAYATESMRLTTRLMQLASWRRLDATMHATPSRADRANPVERQIGLLKAAFEQEQ